MKYLLAAVAGFSLVPTWIQAQTVETSNRSEVLTNVLWGIVPLLLASIVFFLVLYLVVRSAVSGTQTRRTEHHLERIEQHLERIAKALEKKGPDAT